MSRVIKNSTQFFSLTLALKHDNCFLYMYVQFWVEDVLRSSRLKEVFSKSDLNYYFKMPLFEIFLS